MRKVIEQSVKALANGGHFKSDHDEVKNCEWCQWGNKIAWIDKGIVYVNFCGYNTKTTKERINGIADWFGIGHIKYGEGIIPLWAGPDRAIDLNTAIALVRYRLGIDNKPGTDLKIGSAFQVILNGDTIEKYLDWFPEEGKKIWDEAVIVNRLYSIQA
jgi:hypothetical protein